MYKEFSLKSIGGVDCMIEIPSFDVKYGERFVHVVYKGSFDPAYTQRHVRVLDGQVFNVEDMEKSYRIGFSNLPLVEPFPGFAVGLLKKIRESKSSKNVLMSIEDCTDTSMDCIDRAVYSILSNVQFPSIQGKFFGSPACSSLVEIAGVLDEFSDSRSITKMGFDCMRYICLGEAIDDILEGIPHDGVVMNIPLFDEVPYGASGSWLTNTLLEQSSVALMSALDGKIPKESMEFEGAVRKVYSRVRDHYAHASRARVEAQVFVPKG